MRLILSSCDFHNDQSRRRIFDNLGAAAEDCRILFIPNEKATPEKLASGRYVGWLERYGFRRPHILVFDHRDPARIPAWISTPSISAAATPSANWPGCGPVDSTGR